MRYKFSLIKDNLFWDLIPTGMSVGDAPWIANLGCDWYLYHGASALLPFIMPRNWEFI